MAYFRCSVGGASGGGNGADLIVTCSQHFAGLTITCSDGSSYTKTQICPSSSPYEVTFESIPTGTYTISGMISGQTFSTTKTITDFDALLTDIPDGATVTPTDDVQILLNCANIWDKAYTTISQLLADTTSLLAVISDNNAVDYLVRSTTWASTVVADSTAMTYIGADDYCADTLLADATWREAICNSTYFESVLNVKVPTMTSATTPSGTVSLENGTTLHSSCTVYGCFDGTIPTTWNNTTNAHTFVTEYDGGVIYDFEQAVNVRKIVLNSFTYAGAGAYSPDSFVISGSNDGQTWDSIVAESGLSTWTTLTELANNNNKYRYIKFHTTSANHQWMVLAEAQYYGRAATT